ncbi:MAG: GNAT family N-acetyltransferase [Anaerolineaceae bacterium]|nr:GNAT family N-acetyltransferase [Anaerolineaceae bacterium]
MPEISTLRPNQIAEAKRVIYTSAYALFHDRGRLEETLTHYAADWPLLDIHHFEQSYIENGGTFLVCMDDERIIGTGALRRLDEKTGEIKRLWFLPEYQGHGLGYRMMLQLTAVARQNGYSRLRLETTPAYQPRAFAFYQRLGFYEIPRYGDEPGEISMELILE